MQKQSIRNSLVAISLIATASFSGQAAASQCKGLENTACTTNSACSWIEGYQRKDGRQVKSFCRTKPSFKKKGLANASVKKVSAQKVAGK